MSSFFNTVLHDPIYNLLISLIGVVPAGDIGIAVILVTLIVKFATLPLSLSMSRTQRTMKILEPEFKELKEKYKDDKELQAKETFALYKRYNINPFSSILLILVQLPILIALYWVFRGEALPQIDVSILYSFVPLPNEIQPFFLGLLPMTGKSVVLAVLAGITQFGQAITSIPKPPPSTGKSLAEDFGRAMTLQARYVIPFIIAFVSYSTSGAVALYFVTSNLFGIGLELVVRRNKKEKAI